MTWLRRWKYNGRAARWSTEASRDPYKVYYEHNYKKWQVGAWCLPVVPLNYQILSSSKYLNDNPPDKAAPGISQHIPTRQIDKVSNHLKVVFEVPLSIRDSIYIWLTIFYSV